MSAKTLALLISFAIIAGTAATGRGQTPLESSYYTVYINAQTGCYERIFTGAEPDRAVSAAQIIEAAQQLPCVTIEHAQITEALDFTAIASPPRATARTVRAAIEIRNSELVSVSAGALGDQMFTVFAAGVDFSGSQISSDAQFVNAVFLGTAHFRETHFKGLAAFNGVRFEMSADFSRAIFDQLTYFFGARFAQSARLAQARFHSTVRLFDTEFHDESDFKEATFASTVDFSNARYLGGANFTDVHFAAPVTAKNVDFYKTVRFDGVRADHALDFSTTRFLASAYFNRAVLSGARFFGVRFSDADFTSARFMTETSFTNAIFASYVFFIATVFEQSVLFNNALFLKEVLFVGARFSGDVDFSLARFAAGLGPDFLQAVFAKTVNLENVMSAGTWRITWEQVQGRLAPEAPQVLGFLEKNFVEMRRGEDALAACEAAAKSQKEMDAARLRCLVLAATLGLAPGLLSQGLGRDEKTTQPNKNEPRKRRLDAVRGVVIVTALLAAAIVLILAITQRGTP